MLLWISSIWRKYVWMIPEPINAIGTFQHLRALALAMDRCSLTSQFASAIKKDALEIVSVKDLNPRLLGG